MDNVFVRIKKVFDLLEDEISKEVFNARLQYVINKDDTALFNWFIQQDKDKLFCPELDLYERVNLYDKGYIIFGAGREGRRAKKTLQACGKSIIAYADNNKAIQGMQMDGLPILSVSELINNYRQYAILITPYKQMWEVYQQLLAIEFPREKIIIPKNEYFNGCIGIQYFDLFKSSQNEIFIDAGCWNGNTVKDFVRWCNGEYVRIYAFELDEVCWETCERTFKENKIKSIDFVRKGTWSHSNNVGFYGFGGGNSTIIEDSKLTNNAEVISIDEVLDGGPVTYIKMDVEGSELETLKGAKESIVKYKPKLAVSVYHKPSDLWELAEYIITLRSDYKFYLRHYSSRMWETILYAI